MGALKPPGQLGLKSSEMQTLHLSEGISEVKSLAVIDIGGLQVSSGTRQGQAIPEPHILVEADIE